MIEILLAVLGVLLILATLVDVGWTTTAAGSGAGPLTAWISQRCWQLALALHRRWRSPVLLAVAGVAIALMVLMSWFMLVFGGWALIFNSYDSAVRSSLTGASAGVWSRLYFVGYSMLTLGNGEFQPGRDVWQPATVLSTGTGLVIVTLSITYLVPVASAVSQRRAMASYIAMLGSSPDEILVNSWNGSDFGSLSQHLVALTPMRHTVPATPGLPGAPLLPQC